MPPPRPLLSNTVTATQSTALKSNTVSVPWREELNSSKQGVRVRVEDFQLLDTLTLTSLQRLQSTSWEQCSGALESPGNTGWGNRWMLNCEMGFLNGCIFAWTMDFKVRNNQSEYTHVIFVPRSITILKFKFNLDCWQMVRCAGKLSAGFNTFKYQHQHQQCRGRPRRHRDWQNVKCEIAGCWLLPLCAGDLNFRSMRLLRYAEC